MPMLSKIIVPVYDVFNMYAQPGESTEFTQLWKTHFVLGPHGLETVIRLVYLLHEALICRVGNSHWLTPLEWSRLVEVFDLHCRPLLRLLRHFRASTPRHEYDPEGIQDLRQQLSSKIAYFPDADHKDRPFTVLQLDIYRNSFDEFVNALIADFGSDHLASSMDAERLLRGPRAIDGILATHLDVFLDHVPLTFSGYSEFMELWTRFCGALARKMANYKKSSGKQKARADSSTSAAEPGPSGNTRARRNHSSYTGSASAQNQSSSGTKDTPILVDSDDDTTPPHSHFERARASHSYPDVQPEYRQETAASEAPAADSRDSEAKKPSTIDSAMLKLEKYRSLRSFIPAVLRDHPHPDSQRRKSLAEYRSVHGNDWARIWKHMSLVYHPDKNTVGHSPLWRRRCEEITKLGNTRTNGY